MTYQLTITKGNMVRQRLVTALSPAGAESIGQRWAAIYGRGWTFTKAERVHE